MIMLNIEIELTNGKKAVTKEHKVWKKKVYIKSYKIT